MSLREFLKRLFAHDGKSIHYIGGTDILPPPLKGEEETAALEALARGEESARQTLVEHNLRLVVYIARRFENTGTGLEDLISIGTIGLIKGISTFDTGKKIRLATYASRCIENEILMHIRKTSNQKTEVSLDEPINMDGEGNELLLIDILGTEEDTVLRPLEDDVDLCVLHQALAQLPPREKEIVDMRFGLDGRQEMTQKEVAKIMGISQSYISRLEKKIMQRLKKEFIRQTSCA